MISDLTISYTCDNIETTLTIKDDDYDNVPYILADVFAKIVTDSDASPDVVIRKMCSKLNTREE